MNALELVQQVRDQGADVLVRGGQLVVRGTGAPLPDDLIEGIREHRAELLVALGVPIDVTVGEVLADLRPHLNPALQALPDDRLLALVNWNIIAAWESAVRGVSVRAGRAPPRRR